MLQAVEVEPNSTGALYMTPGALMEILGHRSMVKGNCCPLPVFQRWAQAMSLAYMEGMVRSNAGLCLQMQFGIA